MPHLCAAKLFLAKPPCFFEPWLPMFPATQERFLFSYAPIDRQRQDTNLYYVSGSFNVPCQLELLKGFLNQFKGPRQRHLFSRKFNKIQFGELVKLSDQLKHDPFCYAEVVSGSGFFNKCVHKLLC